MKDFVIKITDVTKKYNDQSVLNKINLNIKEGEMFALLGPNGAGKTTLINSICGIKSYDSGNINISGYDNVKHYREARACVGLVPQELTTDAFETVWNTVNFSRGLFGLQANHTYIKDILQSLSLWDKKDTQIYKLSGGMKRRVLIAKALSHNPKILFLDEPSAGIDVELRQSMWANIINLRKSGVTIILTTHYIEEAEALADRIGIINQGKMLLIKNTEYLIKKFANEQITIFLDKKIDVLPDELREFDLQIINNKIIINKMFDTNIMKIMNILYNNDIGYHDIQTRKCSLEDIFLKIVNEDKLLS